MFFQNCQAIKITGAYKVSRTSREIKRGFSEGRSFAALAYRVRGKSRFISNKKTYIADEGSIIYIPAGVAFSRRGGDEELLILHLSVYGDSGDEIEIVKPKNSAAVGSAFEAAVDVWNEKKSGFEYKALSILYSLLGEINSSMTRRLTPYQYEIISPAIELINSSFDSPTLTVSALAAECNVSAEYFRMLYKTEFGISPHRAILEKRLDKARRLLEAGYFTVSKVAEECGFSDVRHFSTQFSKNVGKTPTKYRAER